MAREQVGRVFNYYSRIGVAAIEVTSGEIRVGDTLVIEGPGGSVTAPVESMQVEHQPVQSVTAGQSAGVKVPARVRPGDIVFKVEPTP